MREVNSRIRDLRMKHGLSQKGLASIMECGQQTVSGYETSRIACPIPHLITLADYFNVTVDYLIGRTDNEINDDSLLDDEREMLMLYS